MSNDAKQIVTDLVAKTLSVNTNQLNEDIGPGDIPQWDSFGNQAILAAVEKEFGVAFTIHEVLDIETLGDLIEVIQTKTES